jgi:hypothetical protein
MGNRLVNEQVKSERPGALKALSARGGALLGGAGALALAIGGLTVAFAPGASADGIIKDGNPTCATLVPGSVEIKFDPPNAGAKSADGVTVTMAVRTLLVDDPAHAGNQTGSTVIDFVAAGGTVLGAIVKGGPVANFYDYRPDGVLVGTSLHTPVNEGNKNLPFYGLSHVNFCVAKATTPTPTPTPTPTVTPSETPTPTPSDTPSTAPTSAPSTPIVVPTEVDAGLSGPALSNTSAESGSNQGIWGGVLLAFGAILLAAGALKSLKRRGAHAA